MDEQHRNQQARFARRRCEAQTDADLVAAIQIGDRSALEEVSSRESARILGVARKLCGDQAHDVLQDVLLALWRNPHRFDASRGSLRGFLLLQAHGRAIDLLRSDGSRSARERATHERQTRHPGSRGNSVEEDVLGQISDEAVHTAMANLPIAQRQAITLAYFGGRSYREVAVSLGRPEGTVKGQIRSGLARLASLLAEQVSAGVEGGRCAEANLLRAGEG